MDGRAVSRVLGRKLSRRTVLRSSVMLAGGLAAAQILGCGENDGPAATTPPQPTRTATVSPTATPVASAGTPRAGWAPHEPSGSKPSTRRDHSFTADSEGRQVYLFGGRAAGNPLAELWAYDVEGKSWTQLSPNGQGPAARFGHNAIFDGPSQRMIVFGGQAGNRFFSDVWAYEVRSNAWSQVAAEGRGPQQRYGAGGDYIPTTRALYVSHGFTDRGRFDDTWAFAVGEGSWADHSPSQGERPVKRCLLRTIADPQRNRLVLFGGQSNEVPFLGDTWIYSLNDRRWQRLQVEGPSARNLYAAIRSESDALLVLFGGRTSQGDSADLWTFDLTSDRWSSFTAQGGGPQARNSHDATWLTNRRSMLIFGGKAGNEELNDIWELAFA